MQVTYSAFFFLKKGQYITVTTSKTHGIAVTRSITLNFSLCSTPNTKQNQNKTNLVGGRGFGGRGAMKFSEGYISVSLEGSQGVQMSQIKMISIQNTLEKFKGSNNNLKN